MIIGFYVLAVFFLQCSFSLWKIFVLREIEVCISCGDADKANFVPEAFKLWGGKKKKEKRKIIMQQWSLWDTMLQSTRESCL